MNMHLNINGMIFCGRDCINSLTRVVGDSNVTKVQPCRVIL